MGTLYLQARARPWHSCARARTRRRQPEQLLPKCQRCLTGFLQTGQETFVVAVVVGGGGGYYFSHILCHRIVMKPAASISNCHLLTVAYESLLLFAHHRALCSCMLYEYSVAIDDLHQSD